MEETNPKIKAQMKYCKSQDIEMFAPELCFRCGCHVFDFYSLEECSTTLITKCWKCNTSFVDWENDSGYFKINDHSRISC